MQPNYTQTTVAAPVPVPGSTGGAAMVPFDVDTFLTLRRPLFVEGIIEEPMYQMSMTSANSFFTGNSIVKPQFLTSNLELGTELFAYVEKIQNPLNLFAKEAMSYEDIDNKCLSMLELNCQMACLNTLPSFEMLRFRFDTEYSWGVVACDKNKQFWDMDYFTRQFSKSLAAKNFGREVDMWNKVIGNLKATPATTVDARLAAAQPDHFWENLGSAAINGKYFVGLADSYMRTSLDYVDPKIVITQEFSNEIINAYQTPWGVNNRNERINTTYDWSVPGFELAEQTRQLLGVQSTVLIMYRSPWLTYSNAGALVSQYPLWNNTGTKQYVAILDPRVGFQFAVPGYTLRIQPYDCDHIQRGIQESEYVGSGITFPVWGMILEFDIPAVADPSTGAAVAANEVVKALAGGAAEPAEPAEPVAPAA